MTWLVATSQRTWALACDSLPLCPGSWLIALAFPLCSSQWLAVVGFLPPIFRQVGFAVAAAGVTTALAAGLNGQGKEAIGRLLAQCAARGRVLQAADFTMSMSAVVAFDGMGPFCLQYLPVLVFSVVVGHLPGTLFVVSVRLAPGNHTVSTTVVRMQQLSFLRQLFGPPPLVAWLAVQALGVSGRG